VYVITGAQATIGRGEDNDIVISDLKASRRHAEVLMTANKGWLVRDLGSSNGIQHNGEPTREKNLQEKDSIVVGETVFEFVPSEAPTMLLTARPSNVTYLDPAMRAAHEQRVQAVRSMGKVAGSAPGGIGVLLGGRGTSSSAPNKQRTLLLMVAAAGAAIFLFMDNGDSAKGKNPSKGARSAQGEKKGDGVAPAWMAGTGKPDSPEVARTAEGFFQQGFREFRQGNYRRAKTHFETVLQMYPGHALAYRYREECDTQIKAEANKYMEYGRSALNAGKIKEALSNFDNAMRLYSQDQAGEEYIKAKDLYDRAEKARRGEEIQEGGAQ
jgi:pSer/pThr/pTyr-binding forkhead associated (FHA) protein